MSYEDCTPAEFGESVRKQINNVKSIFETDRMWGAPLVTERIIKANQDIAVENSAGHNTKFCGIELTTTEKLKHLVDSISSHPLLEIDWNCAGPNVDLLDENTLEQLGGRKIKVNFDDAAFTGHPEAKNFDYLLLDKVLCRKADPVVYLNAMKHILRDDGFIIVNEIVKDFELAAVIAGLTVGTRFNFH